ncbi:MAG: (2Fe-2S)-binding protein [Acidobacteriota bacterium]|nr:(2Fe-2S)-binding protein [Acidobacteriota bacterium]
MRIGRVAARERPMHDNENLFDAYLHQYDDAAWRRVLEDLAPSIHDVDRTATRIWFAFFPLALRDLLREPADREWLVRKLQILGRWNLAEQIDVSHRFLYGHRWWPGVKRAIVALAQSARPPKSLNLADLVRDLARDVASVAAVDPSLLTGMVAVALMTWQQVGTEAFEATPGTVSLEPAVRRRTPEAVLRARARDDAQGMLGFLKGDRKTWTVTFDEQDRAGSFRLINSQHLTTAAAADRRDYRTRDARCAEGPIPVECRSASCGTCWVGVLGGAEKLSPMEELERRRLREFGYADTGDERPIIRLACQAQAFGAVSIVIPPWNGVFGKYLENRKRQQAAEAKS